MRCEGVEIGGAYEFTGRDYILVFPDGILTRIKERLMEFVWPTNGTGSFKLSPSGYIILGDSVTDHKPATGIYQVCNSPS